MSIELPTERWLLLEHSPVRRAHEQVTDDGGDEAGNCDGHVHLSYDIVLRSFNKERATDLRRPET